MKSGEKVDITNPVEYTTDFCIVKGEFKDLHEKCGLTMESDLDTYTYVFGVEMGKNSKNDSAMTTEKNNILNYVLGSVFLLFIIGLSIWSSIKLDKNKKSSIDKNYGK